MPPPRRLLIDHLPSPVGTLLLVVDEEDRLWSLAFEGRDACTERQLCARHGKGRYALGSGRAPATIRAPLDAFFAGELHAIDSIAVHTGGTEFQQRVWAALRRIPAGSTTTYSGLAHEIGHPRACRAVGLANGANPVAIIVPCHRVIGANGTLTGYGGGIGRKRWLLDHERRWAAKRSPMVGELGF
jgi:methylated-DNA-[protein]-cysteine S-methyltransferase